MKDSIKGVIKGWIIKVVRSDNSGLGKVGDTLRLDVDGDYTLVKEA